MRKLLITIVGAATLLVAVAATSSAGGGPRLEGAFKVTGTVKDNDFVPMIPPGTKVHDTFKFKSTCASGGCPKVKLTRDAGGRNVKSTLHRIKPGVYKGDEGPEPYACARPLGHSGHFTAKNTVKVTNSDHGLATQISGTSKVHFTGCTETFENVKFKGTLKP